MIAALLWLALGPLDVAVPGPAKSGALGTLRLEARLRDGRVEAQIVNDGPRVRLLMGFSCSGPEPFRLIVDGVERRFTAPRECDKNVERVVELGPGERTEPALSDRIKLGEGTLSVSYRPSTTGHWCAGCYAGELRSARIGLRN
jgi:hypothetical protein